MTSLDKKIKAGSARVGVLGLGYVGLPLASAFAKAGFETVGFEVDERKVRRLEKASSYIEDIPDAELEPLVSSGKLSATTDFSRLARMDASIICVPTPLNKTKDPDISFIASSTEQVARYLHKGQLVVLESTTYPGTTREFVLPLLEKGGFKVGRDFHLAFSPERIDPGNTQYRLQNTPKVVGGVTPACTRVAAALYGSIIRQVVQVSSPESAELVKLLENTFRAVNIGLVNEMALICDKLGLNVWEVIEAARTKPYGFMPFYPGPGLGGHCIPVDPHYLSWKMKSLNFSARFIELAGEINSHMPEFVVEKTVRALNSGKKAVNGSSILVLGVAYKPNVSDVRESPALDVIHLLSDRGARVDYHDPHVPSVVIGERTYRSRPLTSSLLRRADAVVITTPHREFDADRILHDSRLVIDTRNLMQNRSAAHLQRL